MLTVSEEAPTFLIDKKDFSREPLNLFDFFSFFFTSSNEYNKLENLNQYLYGHLITPGSVAGNDFEH
jgi:hypothetical protein